MLNGKKSGVDESVDSTPSPPRPVHAHHKKKGHPGAVELWGITRHGRETATYKMASSDGRSCIEWLDRWHMQILTDCFFSFLLLLSSYWLEMRYGDCRWSDAHEQSLDLG